MKLCLILGDQLSHTLPSLQQLDKKHDKIFMAELWDETNYVKHHQLKIAFLFSAMRHFAKELVKKNFDVTYFSLDDTKDLKSFTDVIAIACQEHDISEIVITQPGEYRVLEEIKNWSKKFKLEVTILEDDRFLSTQQEFTDWASNRKQLRMEYFYRELRKKHEVLLEEGEPVGGKWNYDAENRKPPKAGLDIPVRIQHQTDSITKDVLKLVSDKFNDHFGKLDNFNFAVTAQQAQNELQHFIEHYLPTFGDYQDAMLTDEPFMYHSLISFYLNCGLLLPLECVQAAEEAYHADKAPLNAVEGFIRQILGWREYIRRIYWHTAPDYAKKNFFNAKRKLPEFYWTAKTNMNCIKQSVQQTIDYAYAHHIQRLMVLGNFALLAGINPTEVNEWFLIVYADAYEWVELPNVTGMALFADGGLLASKPYAAGGNYINKMSNYCKNCAYSVKEKTGEGACPFNYLYWDFLIRNRDKLKNNQRLSMIYRTLDKMDADKVKAIEKSAKQFLGKLK